MYSFFQSYVIWKMKRSFQSVKLTGEFIDLGIPVLLICNHMSWWDGIWAFYFNQEKLHRKFHFMMLENQLRKNWFFRFTGGFSVTKKNKSIIETINYAVELLQNSENVVLMFPQGKIQSMHLHKIRFEKGIAKIMEKTTKPVQIVMLANFIDYFSEVKPKLNIYFEEFFGKPDLKDLELTYNDFFRRCIQQQQQIRS